MKGGSKCCQCFGRNRGRWGTRCYDNPKYCCKTKTSGKKTKNSGKKTKNAGKKTKNTGNGKKTMVKKKKPVILFKNLLKK